MPNFTRIDILTSSNSFKSLALTLSVQIQMFSGVLILCYPLHSGWYFPPPRVGEVKNCSSGYKTQCDTKQDLQFEKQQ